MKTIRTDNLRVALNDLRAMRAADGDGSTLPPSVALVDGTTLTIEPFVATADTVGHEAGKVVHGVFTVTRRGADARKMGHGLTFIP